MKRKGRSWKERICALALAVVLVLAGIVPDAALTVSAADGDTMSVEFLVNVENPTITVKNNDSTDEPEVIEKNSEDKYVVNLIEGQTYTYVISKIGYDDVTVTDFAPTSDMTTPVEISMIPSAIDVKTEGDTPDVIGKSQTIRVTNLIEGATYKCESSDSTIIQIDGDQNSGWTLKAIKAGNVSVTISNNKNSQEYSVPLTIRKKTLNGLSLEVVPNSGGENQNKITCSISGLPEDATGTIKFTIGSESGTVSASENSFSATMDEYFGGSVEVSAEYQEDDNYYSAVLSQTVNNFTRNVPLKLTEGETSKEITYKGSENWDDAFSVPIDETTVKGRTLEYSSSNPEVAAVDAITGKITPKHAGTATITVSAEAQDNYITTSVTYEVTVKAKELKSYGDFSWQPTYSRVYNGETSIELQGTLIDDTSYTVTVKATLESADAGAEKVYTIDEGMYNVKNGDFADYTLNTVSNGVEGIIKTVVTIEKRPVYVKADNTATTEIQYGRSLDDLKKEVEGLTNLISLTSDQGKSDSDKDSGYLNDDTVVNLPNATFKTDFDSSKFNVGDTASGVIIPDINKGDAGENYVFAFEDKTDNCRDLKFVAQKLTDPEILKYIKVISEGTNVDARRTEDNVLNEIWVSQDAKLTLGIADEYKDFYDTVMILDANNNEINATKDGITFTDYADSVQDTVLTGKIWLVKSGTSSITDGKNGFNIVHVDTQSPTVKFNGMKNAGVAKKGLAAVTFGLFKNQSYAESVTIDTEEGTEKSPGSGIKAKQYYVWKAGSKIADADLTASALEERIDAITDWTDVPDNNTIPVGVGKSKEEVEENYIVFVRTEDKVGNVDVYVSNGLVIEKNKPSISVDIPDKAYYGEEIPYTLTVDDTKDSVDDTKDKTFKSALKEIKVTVECNGAKTEGGLENGVYKDSYTIDMVNGKTNYTVQELADNSKIEISGLITASETVNNSNDVVIKIDVVDNAGNVAIQWNKEVKIDVTAPVMTVSYDNESAENIKYFKDPRTMTIVYTERNLNTNPDAKDICFDITKDGQLYKDVTLNGLEALDIKWKDKKIEDSQPDDSVKEKEKTDKRTYTLDLEFVSDGEYTISPKCVDKAGHKGTIKYTNENSKTNKTFVIDTKPPVITEVKYIDANGNVIPVNENTRTYTQSSVTAVISITEKNFWLGEREFSTAPEQLDFSATQETEVALKNTLTTADYRKIAAGNSWYKVGEAGTIITFEPDANYTFGFTYKDLAGNEAKYAPRYFTVDKTQPNGTIFIDDRSVWWDAVWKTLTFNIFKNSTYNITLTSDDVTSGVASTAYYYTAQPISEAQVKALPDGEGGWTEGTSFTVSPNEQYVVYGRVIDNAGNIRYLYPTNGAVADNVAPEITITNLSTARNDIFRGDVTLKVDVKDPTVEDTYSGLEKVWYEVNSTGNKVNSKTEVLVDNSNNRVQGSKDYSGNIVIPAADFNSNDVKVQVHAVDFSGNQYDSEIVPLKIDITAPTIQVTYDLNNPSNGKYYNQTRTATVTVTERNFDENAVRFNITNTDGTQPSISGWSRSADAGVMDSATNTCTVSFAADGDYTFTLNCTDLAGNESSYTQVDEFTIDKTVPTINVSFDNNNASNGSYYNAPRTATITVNEHNFNGSEVQTAISASLQSQGISAPGVNGWSTSGDTHTATVYFSADGDYSFTVNYTDLAGNAATAYNVDKFTIDQTKPTVEIFDIVDKSANNGTVAPGVRYSDVNYNTAGVNITITGVEHKAASIDGTRSLIPNGESIKMADFAHEPSVDDIYTLTARVTDMAGNSDEKTVIFSVNRFGSTYRYSKATKKLLFDDYYTNQEQDLVVEEINVDTLEHYGISYGRDGELVNLEKGTDYTVKESGNEVSWKSYLYTIKAKNFEKEGLYDVTIDSRDRATNEVNNKVKNTPIEFVIDKTAPTIVITGLEKEKDANGNVKEQRYTQSSRDINIAYEDNVAMGEIAIYKDDIALEGPWTDEKALKQVDEIPITIESSSNWQKLRAVATDAAGNTAETSEYRVLITSNLLVQFYRNTPLVIGSSISLLAVIALLILLIGKRRKKEEEEA